MVLDNNETKGGVENLVKVTATYMLINDCMLSKLLTYGVNLTRARTVEN